MNNLIDDQLFATLGTYSKNSFFIRFNSDADLQPDPSPCAFPTHAHEFVHYFHNISTTSGIMMIFLNHGLIGMATNFLIKDREGIAISSNDCSANGDISYFVKNIGLINGKFKPDDSVGVGGNGWNVSDKKVYKIKNNERYFSVKISHPSNEKDKNVNGILYIGLDFITEGVAYEIERILSLKRNKIFPSELDKRTPAYPYLTYEPVVNYLVGRSTTPEERIIIGNAALMHLSPSQGLVEACDNLSAGGILLLKEYLDKLVDAFSLQVNKIIEEDFSHIQSFWDRTDKLGKPFERYLSIISRASKMRVKYPLFEYCFLSDDLTAENFLRGTTIFAESFVIQEKSSKTATLINHTSHPDTNTDADMSWFYVMCSAIHFIQQHITLSFNEENGLVEGGKIEKTECLKNVMCPFSGACEVEKSRNYPQECKISPWLSKSEENGACFYIIGIMSITPSPVK